MELFIFIKMDLALNNLQWLICHKTKPNQTKPKLQGCKTGAVLDIWVLKLLYILYGFDPVNNRKKGPRQENCFSSPSSTTTEAEKKNFPNSKKQ